MKRKKHWKQQNPRDQLVALVSTLQGYLLNQFGAEHMSHNIGVDAQTILKKMPPGEWD